LREVDVKLGNNATVRADGIGFDAFGLTATPTGAQSFPHHHNHGQIATK